MKSKRFLCTVLACVVMISCITNAASIQEEVADDFVEYNTESILTTRAIGEFEMTVSAKTKAIADSSLSIMQGQPCSRNAIFCVVLDEYHFRYMRSFWLKAVSIRIVWNGICLALEYLR